MRAPPAQAARGFLLSRGNEKLTKSLNQVEGRCAQFYADELTANAAGNDTAAVSEAVQAVTQAKDAVLGLKKMFSK